MNIYIAVMPTQNSPFIWRVQACGENGNEYFDLIAYSKDGAKTIGDLAKAILSSEVAGRKLEAK